MPGTYTQILLHIVYSTKHREPWITPDVAERLYPYIGGIIRAEKGVLCDIGGVADHVHLCVRWRPDETVSNLLKTAKARSSLWCIRRSRNSPHLRDRRDTARSQSASRKKRP